jgi:tetratricopeptide (TPR) repeat protein
MKTTVKLIIAAFALVALVASAYAQSPREQLQQMAAQLQQTPNDNALREQIIKLALEVKPAPANPEEATRAFVKGNVFQKEAKDAFGYELAITAYREALRSAPWWSDAYFNLAVAQESAGKFDEAIASFRLFMASVPPGSADAREAQIKIYALEAKSEMAIKQAAIKGQEQRISGAWRYPHALSDGVPRMQILHLQQAPDGSWSLLHDFYVGNKQIIKEAAYGAHDLAIVGGEPRFKVVEKTITGGICAAYDVRGTVSADGNALNLVYTLMPFALDRPYEECPLKSSYGSYVRTFTR